MQHWAPYYAALISPNGIEQCVHNSAGFAFLQVHQGGACPCLKTASCCMSHSTEAPTRRAKGSFLMSSSVVRWY